MELYQVSKYRIVFNEETGVYRVERRHWWGWSFVMDAAGEDYLGFASRREAECYICLQRRQPLLRYRRWQVVDLCDHLSPGC